MIIKMIPSLILEASTTKSIIQFHMEESEAYYNISMYVTDTQRYALLDPISDI